MSTFHPLTNSVDLGEEFTEFTNPFDYEVDSLCQIAAQEVIGYLEQRVEWRDELQRGKMFGIMVVRNSRGELGFIAAFSGAIASSNSHSYFVPPIFDILTPEGEFKMREARISEMNIKILELEKCEEFVGLRGRLANEVKIGELELASFKELIRGSKRKRDEIRANGTELSQEVRDRMLKESQFEKAELKRLKTAVAKRIEQGRLSLEPFERQLEELRAKRHSMSEELQRWLFDQYKLLNARGEERTIREIFEQTIQRVPPAATGECAAPKLLQWAYLNSYEPVSMAEFWYGDSSTGEVRHHLSFYPACKARCEPILLFMLQGLRVKQGAHLSKKEVKKLEILFEDEDLLVVNKPEGMLSVRGRAKLLTVTDSLTEMGYSESELFMVHRLDMETSGVVMVARSREIFVEMQRQFATREVSKEYEALLEREPKQNSGWINLPLSADYANRPCQRVDFEGGKEAQTRYEVLERVGDDLTRIRLFPLTGRTHQLRVHLAYNEQNGGLGSPILGDRLYGKKSWKRMCLHSAKLEFTHPKSGKRVIIESSVPF